jgi:hypothetical protein
MSADLPPVQTALQINMHPFDAQHVIHTLPHQIRVWENQVDRILLTVDTGQVNAGRYKGQGFDAAKARLFAFLESLRIKHPKLHIDTVDYGTEAHRKLGQLFFSRAPHYPDKALSMCIFMGSCAPTPVTCCTWTATCCLAAPAKHG